MFIALVSLFGLVAVSHVSASPLDSRSFKHRSMRGSSNSSSNSHLLPCDYSLPSNNNGWHQYKLRGLLNVTTETQSWTDTLQPRSKTATKQSGTSSKTKVGTTVNSLIKGVGAAVSVIITWWICLNPLAGVHANKRV